MTKSHGPYNLPPIFTGLAIVRYRVGGFDYDGVVPPEDRVVVGWLMAFSDDMIVVASSKSDKRAEQFTTIPRESVLGFKHIAKAPPPDEDEGRGGFSGIGIVPDPSDPVWQN